MPEAETARYFSQRAGAGLIVTGSIAISEWARTWAFEPGLYTAAQIAGWQRVTQEVHDHGGVIFGQLRHGGRQPCSKPPREFARRGYRKARRTFGDLR